MHNFHSAHNIVSISVKYFGVILFIALNVIVCSRCSRMLAVGFQFNLFKISVDLMSYPELVITRAALFCNLPNLPMWVIFPLCHTVEQ